jgi:hypothetical protein
LSCFPLVVLATFFAFDKPTSVSVENLIHAGTSKITNHFLKMNFHCSKSSSTVKTGISKPTDSHAREETIENAVAATVVSKVIMNIVRTTNAIFDNGVGDGGGDGTPIKRRPQLKRLFGARPEIETDPPL